MRRAGELRRAKPGFASDQRRPLKSLGNDGQLFCKTRMRAVVRHARYTENGRPADARRVKGAATPYCSALLCSALLCSALLCSALRSVALSRMSVKPPPMASCPALSGRPSLPIRQHKNSTRPHPSGARDHKCHQVSYRDDRHGPRAAKGAPTGGEGLELVQPRGASASASYT